MYCKKCGKEIKEDAKFCPECGTPVDHETQRPVPAQAPKQKKKGKAGKIILTVFLILVGLSIIGTMTTDDVDQDAAKTSEAQGQQTETEIFYAQVSADDLVNDLESNALKAQKTYENQYIEVTGSLDVIDSNGDYIALYPLHKEFCLTSVHCSIQNDEQLNQIMEMNKGDTVTVKGKITAVGEILGYSLDIDEIVN